MTQLLNKDSAMKISKSLEKNLSDSYFLFLKTQNYHWNVSGPNFYSLHKMFEDQYNDLFGAIDLIAERIRVFDVTVTATFKEYLQITAIKEKNSINMSSSDMIKDLIDSTEIVIGRLNETSDLCAGIDEATFGLVNSRIETHEKNIWMLKNSL